MKNGPIYSAVLGAATTMICLGLEFSLFPAIVVGVIAYAAGNMIFSTGTQEGNLQDVTKSMKFASDGVNEGKLENVLAKAARENAQIYFMINKILL